MTRQRMLLDSDFLVAVFRPTDSSHHKAQEFLQKLNHQPVELWVINLVIQESTTVISYKMGMEEAKKFYLLAKQEINQLVEIDGVLEKTAWEIFLKQTKKGTSFIDCANLACLQTYKLNKILSFDAFYPKELRTF